jgi:hypothetical protein
MKIKFTKEVIKKIIMFSLFGILAIVSLTGFLYKNSFDFLRETLNYSLTNLGLSTGLKILAGTFGFLKGISDIIDKVFNFFLIINGLIFFQMTLLKLSNLLVFRILIIVSFLTCFIKPIQKIALKIFIILIFINPGLQIYVTCVKYISIEANLELGKNIKEQMEKINSNIEEGNLTEKAENNAIEQKNEDESIIEKAKSFFTKTKENIITSTSSIFKKSFTYLEKLVNGLLEIVIDYFVTALILFLILPGLYFFVLYKLLKRF